jgi:hypothetical protein
MCIRDSVGSEMCIRDRRRCGEVEVFKGSIEDHFLFLLGLIFIRLCCDFFCRGE